MKTENEKRQIFLPAKRFPKWKPNRSLEERLSSAIDRQRETDLEAIRRIETAETFEDSIKALFGIRN
jgi:hypothetical protein